MDINQTDVLNVRIARDAKDEKHLCPLQLDLIERALLLWSNPGDTVLSPFMGIGSEGYGRGLAA
jgi:DNA modification methylase